MAPRAMSELMAIARESGAHSDELDNALDADTPKDVIIELMAKQARKAFCRGWAQFSESQAAAAATLGLGPECFAALGSNMSLLSSAGSTRLGPDDDELVLLEPAIFREGDQPACPQCGSLLQPLAAPAQRVRFTCCDVEATPYGVTYAEAERLFRARDFDEAESMFEDATIIGLEESVSEGERATCYLYRGLALIELGEPEEAMDCFASACEIVALGTRRGDRNPALEPSSSAEDVDGGVAASTSAVASYMHGQVLGAEGRDDSKAKALIDAAIQMAAAPAIEDIASNVEEVTRSVGTKDYGKKHLRRR